MAANTEPRKIRPWALARVGGTAVSRLKSLPTMASFMALGEGLDGSSPNGSVLSLPAEGKDDAKTLEDLRSKLDEATAALASKNETVTVLLERVKNADSSLSQTHAELEEQMSLLHSSEEAKEQSQKECLDMQQRLSALHAEHAREQSELEAVRHELYDTRAAVEAKSAEFDTEHSARLQAETELQTALAENRDLSAARSQAVAEADSYAAQVQVMTGRIEVLGGQLSTLQEEKAELSTRLSELELSLVEARQGRAEVEVELAKSMEHSRGLEERLMLLTTEKEQAIAEAERKEDGLQAAAHTLKLLEEELERVRTENATQTRRLKELETDLSNALDGHEQTKSEAIATAQEHLRRLQETEQLHQDRQNALLDELTKATSELENRETTHSAEAAALKAAHDEVLQGAVQSAKSAAEASYQGQIAAMRAETDAVEERLRTSHQSAIEQLTAEHRASLDRQANAFQAQLVEQQSTLQAAQTELAKVETALRSSMYDVHALKAQSAKPNAGPAHSPLHEQSQDEEIRHLRHELASAHDAYAALSNDLQDAVRNHAQEVARLQSAKQQAGRRAQQSQFGSLQNAMVSWNAAGAKAEALAPPTMAAMAKIATPALFAWDMVRKCRPLG